jgi:plastocyanin
MKRPTTRFYRGASAIMVAAMLGSLSLFPAPASAQSTGVIQGRVELENSESLRPRRSTQRYPGGQGGTNAIQSLPAVVYLVGPVAGAGVTAEASAVMTQRDTTFVPSVVFVQPGGSVSFPNEEDDFQHDVYSFSKPASFEIGRQNPGSSVSHTFSESGIVEVFCQVHEFMRGAIVVTESPYSAIVGADGSFGIAGVPPGEYTVAFWHQQHDAQEQQVTVTAGGAATLQVRLTR